MSYISAVFAWLSGLSGMVLVPFIILILALCFGVKPGTAVRSALMVGAGILAISTVSSMMIEYVSPLGNALIENTGIQNDMLDLGVAPVFGAVMQLPFFVFLYPIGLLVNFAMLKLKWTKTINVDFLNLFAIVLPALPVYLLTGNVIVTLIVSVLVYMFSLKMADWVAPMYQKYFDLDGVSIPHAFDTFNYVIYLVGNWILDHIPGINKINFSFKDSHTKLGIWGDASFLSFLVGSVLGLVAKMSFNEAMSIGVALACVSFIFPKAVGVIMEGLAPVSEKMRETMQRRFNIEGANIGMDSAILAGYPEAVATGAFAIPIVLLLYFFLPGMRMIPSGESLVLAATMGIALPLSGARDHKGNAFRALVLVAVKVTICLYGAMLISPLATELAVSSGFVVEEGVSVTSSILGAWPSILVYYITKLFV